MSGNGITSRQWAGVVFVLTAIALVLTVSLWALFPIHAPATVHGSSVLESPTASSDLVWPPSKLASLYARFDSTLARGQFGKTGKIDDLTCNVCLEYLNDMLAEYEFVRDLVPVTPVMVSQEARAQFWSRFIRLEGFKTINMDGMSIDARLRLLRRYGYLVNRGLDAADQTPISGVKHSN